jgi:hypothetical protein
MSDALIAGLYIGNLLAISCALTGSALVGCNLVPFLVDDGLTGGGSWPGAGCHPKLGGMLTRQVSLAVVPGRIKHHDKPYPYRSRNQTKL